MTRLTAILSSAILAGFGAAPAQADSRADILSECAKQLKLPQSGCTCIADKADDELTEAQRFLLVATVSETSAERPAGLRDLKPEEVEEVMTFLGTAPGVCATQ